MSQQYFTQDQLLPKPRECSSCYLPSQGNFSSALCSLAQDYCPTASAPGPLSSSTSTSPPHQQRDGKLVTGQERALFTSLPHMEAVPLLSKKCRDRAKKGSSSSLAHRPSWSHSKVGNPIPPAKGEENNSCTPITFRLQLTLQSGSFQWIWSDSSGLHRQTSAMLYSYCSSGRLTDPLRNKASE